MKQVNNRVLYIVRCASVILLCAMMIGCKSKDEPSPQQDTVPDLLKPGTDAAPVWEHIPSRETFNTMTAIVQIPDMFNTYLSDKDEMAVFSANGQILASASPTQESVGQYWLIIEQPKGSTTLTVKWYCDKLTRIYTVQTFPDFLTNKMIGNPQPYVLTFKDK